MQGFLDFFQKNMTGVILVLLSVFVLVYFLNSIAKIFGWGRYKALQPVVEDKVRKDNWSFVLQQFFVKIITDFRSFLALFLVITFACTLIYAISISNKTPQDLSTALQAVMSTLGGLVASIVGYYFGESAKSKRDGQNLSDANVAVQPEAAGNIPDIPPVGPPQQD